MVATITFIWPEKNIEQTFESLEFRHMFSEHIGDCPLFSAELDPPVKLSGQAGNFSSKIHFTNFSLFAKKLFISTSLLDENLEYFSSVEGNLKFKIITPELFHNPAKLNKKLKNIDSEFRVHLFYKDDRNSATPFYFSSVLSTWSTLDQVIKQELLSHNLGKYGVSVNILGDIKTLNSADYFRKPDFRRSFMKDVMCITISSSLDLIFYYGETELLVNSVLPIPRNIIQRCSDIIISQKGKDAEVFCRRIVSACFNGALPLNLFDFLEIEMAGLKPEWNFNAKNFDRAAIHFEEYSDENILKLEADLKVPLFNLKNILYNDVSEFDIRVMFWEQVFNIMIFRVLDCERPVFYYRPSSEWKTDTICANGITRRVDFVILMKIGGMEIPALICEIGKGEFGLGVESHKDFSKLVSMLSLACKKMAKELELDGRNAEDARVFGKWVGRTQVHFCVAHPVIKSLTTEDGNEYYSLHAHVTFPDEWKLDIFSDTNYSISDYSSIDTNLSGPHLRDAIIAADPEVDSTYNSPVTPASLSAEAIVLKTDFKAQSEYNPDPLDSTSPVEKLFSDGVDEINLHALSRIEQFYKALFARISYLGSDASKRALLTLPREFKEGESPQFIVASRASSTDQSPLSEQVREKVIEQDSPSSRALQKKRKKQRSLKTYEIEIYKKSSREFSIYQDHLCKYENYFPKVYHMEKVRKDLNLYRYIFERMFSLNSCRDVLTHPEFGLRLLDAADFALTILNCLHILHSKLKFVHSDISPANIMYCNYSEIWKLNDYDHCLPIEESLRTKRTAGTRGYIAPESLQSGIFTPASDIWSLGRLIADIILAPLLNEMEWSRSDISPEHANGYYEFESIVFEMTMLDASKRPTAKAALKRVFELLSKFENGINRKLQVYRRVTRLFSKREPMNLITLY